MNSFNHYAYGAIGEWMYRVMAGHRDRRGRPRLQAHPHPAAAGRRLHEREGQPRDAVRQGGLRLDAQGRPVRAVRRDARQHPGHGAAAEGAARGLPESGKPLADGNGVTGHRQDGDVVVVEIGSGQYRFAYGWSGN